MVKRLSERGAYDKAIDLCKLEAKDMIIAELRDQLAEARAELTKLRGDRDLLSSENTMLRQRMRQW